MTAVGKPVSSVPRFTDDENTDALRHLQQVHAPVLLSFVTRLTNGDVQRAEDIVQETMLRAWNNPDARNDDGRWSRAWLFTVAKRIVIDQIRAADARPNEVSLEHIESYARQEDAVDRMLDAQEVRAALAALPERLRSAVVEIYFRERPVAEVAELLDVPQGTVKSRTYYALRALREALVKRGFDFRPGQHSGSGTRNGEPPV
ncbi:sigma-70 family RNA polymerase sigma factor [Actinoplanes sp. NPDC049265]|uniref:sigma-70 family RNA polymerase sigma factor n=1 Tax=Actinoplanes sp. NPDC049265 TaxID=3363902 RepID=UPI003713BF94